MFPMDLFNSKTISYGAYCIQTCLHGMQIMEFICDRSAMHAGSRDS